MEAYKMDVSFIRDRITQLRIQKGISEYKMSLDLGHSKSYIQSISSGKSLPSIPEFLYICDYLGIEPNEFFDTKTTEPILIHELMNLTKDLNQDDLSLLIKIAQRLRK